MAYNPKSLENLKPFTGADDPRRKNGRDKGSRNHWSRIQEIVDEQIDPRLLRSRYTKELYNNAAGDLTYTEGIMLALAARALEGDSVAASLFFRAAEKAEKFAPTDFYKDTHFVFDVIESREQWEEIQRQEQGD